MSRTVTVTYRTPEQSPQIIAQSVITHGYVQIAGAYKPSFLQGLAQEIEVRCKGLSKSQMGLEVGDKRFMLPLRLDGPFSDPKLYANPVLLNFLYKLLGKDMLIANITCVTAFPGAAKQHYHHDHPTLFDDAPAQASALPCYAITVSIPLVALTPQTGTTAMLRGSHRQAKKPPARHAEFPYTELGDVYAMDYRMAHFGTANKTNKPRPIIYIVFARPWFVDGYNFDEQPPVNLPTDARIPSKYKKLFRRTTAQMQYKYW